MATRMGVWAVAENDTDRLIAKQLAMIREERKMIIDDEPRFVSALIFQTI
jgi:hypothetical protein